MNEDQRLDVSVLKDSIPSLQAAIEHISRHLLRHDRLTAEQGRRFSDFDALYLCKLMGELITIREACCESWEKSKKASKELNKDSVP